MYHISYIYAGRAPAGRSGGSHDSTRRPVATGQVPGISLGRDAIDVTLLLPGENAMGAAPQSYCTASRPRDRYPVYILVSSAEEPHIPEPYDMTRRPPARHNPCLPPLTLLHGNTRSVQGYVATGDSGGGSRAHNRWRCNRRGCPGTAGAGRARDGRGRRRHAQSKGSRQDDAREDEGRFPGSVVRRVRAGEADEPMPAGRARAEPGEAPSRSVSCSLSSLSAPRSSISQHLQTM